MMHRSAWAEGIFSHDPDEPFALGMTFGSLQHVMTPQPVPEGVVYEYVTNADVTMHLYRRADAEQPRPCVVFVHGGSWSGGDPLIMIRHANSLAERGYVTASVAYRLCPPNVWPGCLEDVRGAVRWIRTHAARLGVDPERIGISGESAGAHIAAMTALGPDDAISAAVLWSVPTDLVWRDAVPDLPEIGNRVLGTKDPDALRAASPIWCVSQDAPPMLLLAGRDDPATPLPMIERFHEALLASGGVSRLEVFEGSHGFDVAEPALRERTFALMHKFFDSYL